MSKSPKKQNRGFFLAEGIRKLASSPNSLSLMLRYLAHAERQYRRAVDEFERLKKLRSEMLNEPRMTALRPPQLMKMGASGSSPDRAVAVVC